MAAMVPLLALPVLGTALFLALFSVANPLISDAFARLDLITAVGGFSIARLFFWLLVTLLVWSLLRPPRSVLAPRLQGDGPLPLPGVSPASIALSLAAFNLLFALQNGLDIAFLWSGAPLPGDLTLADYAHRGAYPLIATALLAALFVLLTLRPGTPTGESPLVRALVYVWIAQNVVLVASTMLRTFDYIESYSLTRLRIAALVWMALVAIGLILICVRLWRRKTALADQRQSRRRPRRPRRLLGRGPRRGGRSMERAPCHRSRRTKRPARPVLPQSPRPVSAVAARRAGESADRTALSRAGELDPQSDHGPALHPSGRLARLDLPQRPPHRRGEAADRLKPPSPLLGERARLQRPPYRPGRL